jgi:hypothetical protein
MESRLFVDKHTFKGGNNHHYNSWFFLLDNLVKKDPIWTSIKKIIMSIWTSNFEVVHRDWVVFLIGKMLDYLIGHFD